MTVQEFIKKHDNLQVLFEENAQDIAIDILDITIANLSDLHFEKSFFTEKQMDNKINSLKDLLWDLQEVLKKS